jgi:hypothetical protein
MQHPQFLLDGLGDGKEKIGGSDAISCDVRVDDMRM